jgi:serine/threonine-protein kinase
MVGDRLVVQRLLGSGGLGNVYEVIHKFTRHRRALKVLRARFRRSAEVVDRFLREASAAGRIGNPHIVETFDAGYLDDGSPFIVMEFLEGKPLNEVLREHGRLDSQLAAALMAQVCTAVQAAHDAGVIHRDLKPENLFLTERDGRAFMRVLDFGISKFEAEEGELITTTRSGITMGTPLYMAPEQLENAKNVDVRSDVYSLGVILYQLISGALPFSADGVVALAIRVFEGRHSPLHAIVENVPRSLSDAVDKAMSVSPAGRFQSARSLGEALLQFAHNRRVPELLESGGAGTLAGLGVASQPGVPGLVATPFASTSASAGRSTGLWVAAAFVAGLALVLGGLLASSKQPAGSGDDPMRVPSLVAHVGESKTSSGAGDLDAGLVLANLEQPAPRQELTDSPPREQPRAVLPAPQHEGAPRAVAGGARTSRPPRLGTVEIACQPVSCSVSVDGKPFGETPLLNRQLVVGTHTVVLTNSETGLSQTRSLEVKAAGTTKLIVPF